MSNSQEKKKDKITDVTSMIDSVGVVNLLPISVIASGLATIGKKIKNKKQKEEQKTQIDPKSDLTIFSQNKDWGRDFFIRNWKMISWK